ncbi:MAG: YitT family protein [Christensenellales bacterium]
MEDNSIKCKDSTAKPVLDILWRIGVTMLGAVICAIGVNAFLVPQGFLSGGITGVGMLVNHYTGLPTWVSVAVLNLPLVIIGFFRVSRRFIGLSVVGYLSFTTALALTENIHLGVLGNPLLGALVAGVVTGTGVGLEMRVGASQGGLDILSVMLYKKYNLQMGMMGTVMNAAIMLFLAFTSSLELAVLSYIALIVNYKVLDMIQTGFNKTNTVLIVSQKWQKISEELMCALHKGITVLHGEGAYSGESREILYVVLKNMEISRLRDIVKKEDPAAFVSIIDTKETHGRSFETWKTF